MKRIYERIVVSDVPPTSGDMWIDTSGNVPILKTGSGFEWKSPISPSDDGGSDDDDTDYGKYFTIEATQDGTKVYFRQSSYAVTAGKPALKVQVSTDDGVTWTEKTASAADGGVPGTIMAELDKDEKILVKGNNSAYGYYNESEQTCFENCNFWADKNCYVYGNIMSLTDEDDYSVADAVSDYAFAFFFSDYECDLDWSWVLSKEGEKLLLPATTLADSCYSDMFVGCTGLTSAPELPATTLAEYCYYNMFRGCTNLSQATQLPATTLAIYCYCCMFSYCTSLTTVPELPATTLAEGCYESMFSGCSSLTTAPDLPATTMQDYCYSTMFSECASLIAAPTLPATTLASNCYGSMFRDCTSIIVPPELPATTLVEYCYNTMFSGCTSLATAPVLPATTMQNSCYSAMFIGCTSLTVAPELPATTLVQSCYGSMFSGCTSLTVAPELPATTLVSNCYFAMFSGCTNLSYIKAMFTTTPGNSYTKDWAKNVNGTGTFVKNSAATWNVTGDNGVPAGWTVETASE